jgi:glycerophosphoryl diester phosphodiesterase
MNKPTRRVVSALMLLGTATYLYFKKRSTPIADHPFLQGAKPLVMAHRGGQGLWPPNTLYAFQKASKMGVDILEMDIHSTADDVLVVRHDETVDRTTDGNGAIRDYSLAELKKLDAGYRWSSDGGVTYPFRGQGIKIPTLLEVLEAFPDIRLNIDIKPKYPDIVPLFIDLLKRYNRTQDVLVASFHDHQLRNFRELCPQIATAAGVEETRLLFGLNLLGLGATYQPLANAFQVPEYSGWLHVITPRFVRAAHAHNMEVHVWTVNDPVDMLQLLNWGVDGLITDYPSRMLGLIELQKSSIDKNLGHN